ncbi:MAG: Uma2 family endonuclease [Blastocatellia bacterium]
MSALIETTTDDFIFYPESDGKPMAENTKQFEWIVTIKEGLNAMLPRDFVAGDLLWYPVKGNPKISQAPDAMVAIGRPKGHRGSYKQWVEENIAPQVVFEILSPGNTVPEMLKKFSFYNLYEVEEYYVYDPDDNLFWVWIRQEGNLQEILNITNWTSPRLGVRFELTNEKLEIYRPDGEKFLTYEELDRIAKTTQAELTKTQTQLEKTQTQLETAQAELEKERLEKERLKQKLKELGIE